MADVVFVLTAIAFFALCVLYVRACERIVGSTADVEDSPSEARR
jgi:hypothetical protein